MTSQDPGPYRALVFGASGITGWALVKEALEYPSRTTFDKVLGLTRRPLSTEKALLPVDDERLVLHSGLDLNAGTSQTETLLKQIEGIEAVTHVYFACSW
jgi:nucleoside-diphosphate-sugar epimerase